MSMILSWYSWSLRNGDSIFKMVFFPSCLFGFPWLVSRIFARIRLNVMLHQYLYFLFIVCFCKRLSYLLHERDTNMGIFILLKGHTCVENTAVIVDVRRRGNWFHPPSFLLRFYYRFWGSCCLGTLRTLPHAHTRMHLFSITCCCHGSKTSVAWNSFLYWFFYGPARFLCIGSVQREVWWIKHSNLVNCCFEEVWEHNDVHNILQNMPIWHCLIELLVWI